MPISPRELRELLLASNNEFQRLASEHSRYETQLEQLTKQPYLNSEDLILEIKLKKMKLRVKDEMEKFISQHQHEFGRI
jgi:uncharacterized protein YdcH (DUF465 family)